jgi:hypothetical protein
MYHVSIRITPGPGAEDWINATDYPNFGRDRFDNKFITLGAGPNSNGCGPSQLVQAGFNRDRDVNEPPSSPLQILPLDGPGEIPIRTRLIERHKYFIDHNNDKLDYNCRPDWFGEYNSNSYAHGLLHAADAPHSERPFFVFTPGWETLVPAAAFTTTIP